MGLADRFREALETAPATSPVPAEVNATVDEARTARAELMEDLRALAQAIGHVEVTATDEALLLEYLGRSMAFRPIGEGDRIEVILSGRPEKHRVYRERELQNRWVWSWERLGREEKVPFLNKGLEALLVRGLGLPAVSAKDPEAPMSRRTAEALLRPKTAPEARDEPDVPRAAPDVSNPDERFAPDGTRKRRL